jgi:hypothetical protein
MSSLAGQRCTLLDQEIQAFALIYPAITKIYDSHFLNFHLYIVRLTSR